MIAMLTALLFIVAGNSKHCLNYISVHKTMQLPSRPIQFVSICFLILGLSMMTNIRSSSALDLSPEPIVNTSHSQEASVRSTPSAPCLIGQPKVNYKLPDDKSLSSDDGANCFAWQSFIALNWPASADERGQPDTSKTAQYFGTPEDVAATVWQTYKLAESVFLSGATTPSPWNTDDPVPEKVKPILKKMQLSRLPQGDYLPVLTMVSKVDSLLPGEEVVPDSEQATNNILVDQPINIVHYEKRINKTEFDYIVNNELYNANKQAELVETEGINLPTGSIEIKSAWRILEGQPEEIQNRYKQVKALLYDPNSKTYSEPTLVGLVGLHIIRKTPTMKGFLWSTFEQVDNVDDKDSSHAQSIPYSFYNPNCPADICPPNKAPQNNHPPYHPVQVTRELQIPDNVDKLNKYVQQEIRSQNQDSVWQFYKLVNVKWPKNSNPDPAGQNVRIKDFITGINKLQYSSSNNTQQTSNVTMETYIQKTDCLQCHQKTPIAANEKLGCIPAPDDNNLLQYPASDFSFLLKKADTPDHYAANNCKKTFQHLRTNFLQQLAAPLK